MALMKIFSVVERDLQLFLRFKILILMRWATFIVQILTFGAVASRLITVMDDYFEYYVPGVAVITMYSLAIFIGYEIMEEAEHGVVDYLLSLPLSRRELVIGRALGGGLRSFICMFPLVLVALVIVGSVNVFSFTLALISLFLLAFGLSGFSITLAVSLKSSDRFDVVMGVLDALIIRLSAAMYPLAFMPRGYVEIASINPITYTTDILRWGLCLDAKYLLDPIVDLVFILAFFMSFITIGPIIYERKLEGGGWR